MRGPGCKEWAEVKLVIVSLIREKSLLGLWVEQESKPGLPLPLVSQPPIYISIGNRTYKWVR